MKPTIKETKIKLLKKKLEEATGKKVVLKEAKTIQLDHGEEQLLIKILENWFKTEKKGLQSPDDPEREVFRSILKKLGFK